MTKKTKIDYMNEAVCYRTVLQNSYDDAQKELADIEKEIGYLHERRALVVRQVTPIASILDEFEG